MFPLKVAEHILRGCGPGNLHPELLLELLLLYVTLIISPDRRIQRLLHLLMNVNGINHQTGLVQHVAATALQQMFGTPGTPQPAAFQKWTP
eukprot:12901566-Prorocentrum_lima.AAC.1